MYRKEKHNKYQKLIAIITISSNVCIFTVLVKNRFSMIIIIEKSPGCSVLIAGRCKRLLCRVERVQMYLLKTQVVTKIMRTLTIYAFPRKLKDMFIAPGPKLGHFMTSITLPLRDVYITVLPIRFWWRQRGRVVRASDLKSVGRGFKSHSDRY